MVKPLYINPSYINTALIRQLGIFDADEPFYVTFALARYCHVDRKRFIIKHHYDDDTYDLLISSA
ncbi:MAG: hypothetical protein WC365_06375 [Candidatus Babeliales bacterium]|jgi:hypothetical protein